MTVQLLRAAFPVAACVVAAAKSLAVVKVDDAVAESLRALPPVRERKATLVSEKGYQELQQSLPACAIVFDRDSALPNRRSKQ